MEVLALALTQLVATLAAVSVLSRRIERANARRARMRRVEAAQEAEHPRKSLRARRVLVTHGGHDEAWTQEPSPAHLGPAHLRVAPHQPNHPESESVHAAGLAHHARTLAATGLAASPAFAFAFGLDTGAGAALGLATAALVLLASGLAAWRHAVWVGVAATFAWTLASLFSAGAFAPWLASAAFAAGAAGLLAAAPRRFAPGALAALIASAGLLTNGASYGLVAPSGAAFAGLVALAAAMGAISARRLSMNLAAFAAACAGLYALSGQPEAAVWFTPAAAWAGAIFLGVALVRLPAFGARGALLAGTGVAAPLFATAALYVSQHGLASAPATSGVFMLIAFAILGALALAARRLGRGVGALKLTGWLLVAAIILAAACAIGVLASAPALALGMSAAALGLITYDRRAPDVVWRMGATLATLIALGAAWSALDGAWPSLTAWALALAGPALLLALAARQAHEQARATGAGLEVFAILLSAAAAHALIRDGLSDGAPNTAPVGFVEAGAHVAAAAAIALLLAVGARNAPRAIRAVRSVGALGFSTFALCASVLVSLFWLTPYWTSRPIASLDWPLLQHAPLGFALPALIAWAHVVHWRAQKARGRVRLSWAAATMLSAAFVCLEVLVLRHGADFASRADGVSIALCGLVIAIAAVANLLPGFSFVAGARHWPAQQA